ATMADRCDLPGLPLAAVEGSANDIRLRATDACHGPPEVGRRRLVGDVAQHACEPSVLDAVETLTRELEVVTLHVDRPGLVPDDVHATVDAGDQVRRR